MKEPRAGIPADDRIHPSFEDSTVTAASPLRIQRDGDDNPLPFVPDSLFDVDKLVAGDRVRVENSDGRLIIHGRAGGNAIVSVPAGADLNTYLTTGTFIQTSDANATPILNYPITSAGLLEVFKLGTGTRTYQRYTPGGTNTAMFWRSAVSGAWTPWRTVYDDTLVGTNDTSIIAMATGWALTGVYASRRGGYGTIMIRTTRSGALIANNASGDIGNQTIGTLTSAWWPAQTYVSMGSGPGGRAIGAYLNENGALVLSGIGGTSDFAVSSPQDFGGTYPLANP